jgi:hypothetical protein
VENGKMAEPSVKGSIIQSVIEDIVRLRDEGGVTDEDLEARLEPGDLALLDSKVYTAAWHPMASYSRFLQLLGDLEGGGDPDYYVGRGRKNARRLMDAGLYQQLSFIKRWRQSMPKGAVEPAAAVASYTRNLKLVVTLAKSIYNVGRWVVEADEENPGRVWIAIRDASDYSEPMRLAAEGFLNECGSERSRASRADMYTSERPSPDLILFRMNFDIVELLRR